MLCRQRSILTLIWDSLKNGISTPNLWMLQSELHDIDRLESYDLSLIFSIRKVIYTPILVILINNEQYLSFYGQKKLSFHLARISVEGDSVTSPSFLAWLSSIAQMEPPSIRLDTIILIDGNCAVDLMRENLKSDSIVGPAIICGIHCSAKVVPPSSIGGSLVVVELIKRDCSRIIISRDVEGYSVVNPAVAQVGIG